jgi:hypothetical protein
LTIGSGREARYVEQITKILVALAILAALPVMALDEEDVRIDKEGRAYLIHMVFDVPAHVNQIKTVLTDFTHPSRLSSAVTAREVLGQQGGVVRVRTEFRDCVLFFCKKMILIHDVTVSANEVRAFEAVMEPDFFVPPLIGGFLVRNALAKQVLATAENLVREAPRESPTTDEKQ